MTQLPCGNLQPPGQERHSSRVQTDQAQHRRHLHCLGEGNLRKLVVSSVWVLQLCSSSVPDPLPPEKVFQVIILLAVWQLHKDTTGYSIWNQSFRGDCDQDNSRPRGLLTKETPRHTVPIPNMLASLINLCRMHFNVHSYCLCFFI